MICFRRLCTIDVFPHTVDINSGVSRHVETVVLLQRKGM